MNAVCEFLLEQKSEFNYFYPLTLNDNLSCPEVQYNVIRDLFLFDIIMEDVYKS